METTSQSTAIIIPAYNAETSLLELVNRLRYVLGYVQIIVVDDGSIDNTSEIATSVGTAVIRHKINCGKGAALQTGFNYVKNNVNIEFVLTIDADLQHQPEEIPKFFIVQQNTGADVVIGWRERIGTQMPVLRILSNTITSALVGLRTGINIKDSQCGFRLIRRKVIESIRLETNGYEAETEFLIKLARQGYKVAFVPINTIYGNEKSYMTHFMTTLNFIKALLRKYE